MIIKQANHGLTALHIRHTQAGVVEEAILVIEVVTKITSWGHL